MKPLDREALGIAIPYPVEVYGIEGMERPVTCRGKCRLVVTVECHGEAQRYVVETLSTHGQAAEIVRMGKYFAFVPNGRGGHTVKRYAEVCNGASN